MDRLNFNHLYYFYLVARNGSIKEVSEKIHISQPTISDQIKLLEEFFKVKLFERRNRALFLTKEGKLALQYAERIFDLGAEVSHRLKNKIDIPKSNIDIGITHFMSQYFLYESILPFFKDDEIKVRVSEGERGHLLSDLDSGRFDIIFTDSKESLPSTMSSFRIGINKTYAIAHKKFRNNDNFPSNLNEIPFFNYTNESFLKDEINLFFTKHSLTPKIIGEADDIDLLQLITEKGLAFTIVPEAAKKRICKNKEIIVLGELKELQTSVWGIIKNSYKGICRELLEGFEK